MFFDGNAASLLHALREKKRLLTSGESHDHIRPLLFICGGIMKGVYGGGAVTALHECGFGEVFDVVAGVSTGAATAVYFLSGQPRHGTTIYSEECCTPEFINAWRFTNMCDSVYIMGVFQRSEKRLDVMKALHNRSQLVLGVTHRRDASQRLMTPDTPEELFQCLHASILMPGVSQSEVYIEGESYVDGSYSDPLPIEKLIEEHNPTHILVIANREYSLADRTPLFERILNNTLFRTRMSAALRRSANRRREVLSEKFNLLLAQQQIPAVVFWGDGTVGGFTRDPARLVAAVSRTEEIWTDYLGGQQ